MQLLGWAFGAGRLADLAVAAHDAALRARYLYDVPDDQGVHAELGKNLAAMARQAERLQLDSQAALARRLARALGTQRAGADALVQVRDGCDALERHTTQQVAREAGPRPPSPRRPSSATPRTSSALLS